MSAKNWRKCPRCLRQAETERREKLAEAERAYGIVPPARFLRLNEEATAEPVLRDTLREDYEIGVNERGVFEVRYRAECQKCDFGFEYKAETPAEAGKE